MCVSIALSGVTCGRFLLWNLRRMRTLSNVHTNAICVASTDVVSSASSSSRTHTHTVPKIVLINTITTIINSQCERERCTNIENTDEHSARRSATTKKRIETNFCFTWLVSHFLSQSDSSSLALPQNQEEKWEETEERTFFLFVKFCGDNDGDDEDVNRI